MRNKKYMICLEGSIKKSRRTGHEGHMNNRKRRNQSYIRSVRVNGRINDGSDNIFMQGNDSGWRCREGD